MEWGDTGFISRMSLSRASVFSVTNGMKNQTAPRNRLYHGLILA